MSSPYVQLGQTSLTLKVGETKSLPATIYDGGFWFASNDTNKGTASWNGSGVNYTAKAVGSDSVTVYASNACWTGGSAFSVTVLAAATPVTAGAASLNTNFMTPGSIAVPAAGTYSTLTVTGAPAHGTASFSGSTITYTPTGDYFGSDTLTYQVSGEGGTASNVISITVATPPAPIANGGSMTTPYRTAVSGTVSVTGYYTGLNLVSQPAHGTAMLTGNNLTYTPAQGFIGTDDVKFKAVGPQGGSNEGIINVTVVAPAAPVAGNSTASLPWGSGPSLLPMTQSGYWETATITTPPSHGSAVISGNFVRYTPTTNYEGPDYVEFKLDGPSGTATGRIDITNIDAPIETVTAQNWTVPFNTPYSATIKSAEGTTFNTRLTGSPSHGTFTYSGGKFRYTPATDYFGEDQFLMTWTGPTGKTTSATMTVTVQTPALPVATATNLSVPYRTGGSVNLTASGFYSSLALVGQPAHGTAVLTGNNLVYTPEPTFFGADEVKFKAVGLQGESEEATVSVTVVPPTAPIAGPSTTTVGFATTGASFQVVEGGFWETSAITAGPSHGTASLSGKDVTYTPDPTYEGPDAIEYSLTGPNGTATGRVDITVSPAPFYTALDQNWSTTLNTPVTQAVMSAEGSAFGSNLVGTPQHGTFAFVAGQHRYTPADGFMGTDTFPLTWTGLSGKTSTATMTVTVAPPQVPGGGDVAASTPYNTPTAIPLTSQGRVTGYRVTGQGTNGQAAISGTELTYTPANGFVGDDVVTFVGFNEGGDSQTRTARISVASPGAPTIQPASANVEQGQTVTIPLSTSGVVDHIEIGANPASGTVTLSGASAVYAADPTFVGQVTFGVVAVGAGGRSPESIVTVSVNEPPPPPPPPVTCWDNSTAATLEACPIKPPPSQTCPDGTVVTAPATCPPTKPAETIEAKPAEASTPLNTPVAMNLMRLVQGAPVASLDVVQQAEKGHVEIEGSEAVYTPRENVTGEDSFIYRATSENGATAQAKVTVVIEKGSVPTVSDVRIEVVAGVPFSVDLAPAADGGPFDGADVVEAPTKGQAAMAGTVLTYTAPIDFEGDASLRFTIRNEWGASSPAQLIASVLPAALPASELHATVLQGKTVEIDLTQGARGGPFTGATIAAFDEATGNAKIERRGDRYVLVYSSKGAFSGAARVGFTLANARTVSAMAFVVIDVVERENPALNREVSALVNAQETTAQRFGDAQLDNVIRRLEGTHGGRRQDSLSIGLPRDREILGHDAEARQSFAADLDKAFGRDPVTSQSASPRSQNQTGDVSVWLGGSLDLGRARGNQARAKARFTTGGISAGMDTRIGDKVIVGTGVGFGNDETRIGDKGTKSSANSTSMFGYASYQPGKVTFFDAVLGLSKIDFDSERYVEATGNLVSGTRRGQQVFGAFSAGWEHNGPKLMISPYGRLQFVFTDLSGFIEQGDDTYALAFLKQTVSDVEAAIGVRGQTHLDLKNGELIPSFRLEYRQKLHTGGVARMRYADWADSPIYATQPYFADENSALVGVGGTYRRGDWTFGGEVETTAGNSGSTTTRVRASGSTKF